VLPCRRHDAGKLELELVPQGNLAERIRAAGAGIGAFFTPTGFGTQLADGKKRGKSMAACMLLEHPIHADFALIQGECGDRWQSDLSQDARNFGPIMASAAKVAIASVHDIVELGSLDPEAVVTPGCMCSA